MNGKTLIHFLETLTKYFIFKEKIINFIRPSPNAFFERHNPQGIKLITRLRLGLRHLRKHKFKQFLRCNKSFKYLWSRYWVLYFFHFLSTVRSLLIKDALSWTLYVVRSFDSKLSDCTSYGFTQTLVLGITFQISSNNFKTIDASIFYVLWNKRFDEPLS